MAQAMEFFMPMQPPTATRQQQGHIVKNGRHLVYGRSNRDAEEKLKAHLAKHRPREPIQGPIRITVVWCFPTSGKHKDGTPHTQRPDIDNLCKAMYDVMTKLGFWGDDKQIYHQVVEKFYSDPPGIYVKIETGETL